jgi:hypothetical protein
MITSIYEYGFYYIHIAFNTQLIRNLNIHYFKKKFRYSQEYVFNINIYVVFIIYIVK